MIKFRLYPENRSLYFEVRIYPTKKQMQKDAGRKDFAAICQPFKQISCKNGKYKTLPICGVIRFWQKDMGVGTISHELLHAVLDWGRRVKIINEEFLTNCNDTNNDLEERLCHVYGEMVRQFVNQCYKRKIYK